MKTFQVIATAAAALSVLGSAGAYAQGAPTVKQACMPDVQRLCPNAVPGHGWIMQCLKGHMNEVAPACKTAVDTMKANRAARKAQAAQTPPPAPGAASPQ